MNKRTGTFILTALSLAGLGTAGCERKPQQRASDASKSTDGLAPVLPENLFVQEAPAGARDVTDVKADKSATAEVVVHGRIGGRKEPFVDGAAMFMLADVNMRPCNELHGDRCPTPWDYCCEPRESLVAKVATIQVIGADGRPLRINLKGKHGLEPLAELTVAGEVAQRDEHGTLVINAREIHVNTNRG
ncbi:MAG: hypothetical protein JSV78_11600 [Phycisphaerales bacterium]|nr:MAG: hypothetical protein JSV78_11600 [Phycisphaerales bacterium]